MPDWHPRTIRESYQASLQGETYQIDMNCDGNWTACRLTGRRVVGIGHYFDSAWKAAEACCRSAGVREGNSFIGGLPC